MKESTQVKVTCWFPKDHIDWVHRTPILGREFSQVIMIGQPPLYNGHAHFLLEPLLTSGNRWSFGVTGHKRSQMKVYRAKWSLPLRLEHGSQLITLTALCRDLQYPRRISSLSRSLCFSVSVPQPSPILSLSFLYSSNSPIRKTGQGLS